jgi:hypothetical protein
MHWYAHNQRFRHNAHHEQAVFCWKTGKKTKTQSICLPFPVISFQIYVLKYNQPEKNFGNSEPFFGKNRIYFCNP